MTENNTRKSHIIALAAQWVRLGRLLYACARRVSNLQYAGAGNAWAEADKLELWVRSALGLLNQKIKSLQARKDSLTPEEIDALYHLQAIAVSLLMLTILVQHYKSCGPRGGFCLSTVHMICVRGWRLGISTRPQSPSMPYRI